MPATTCTNLHLHLHLAPTRFSKAHTFPKHPLRSHALHPHFQRDLNSSDDTSAELLYDSAELPAPLQPSTSPRLPSPIPRRAAPPATAPKLLKNHRSPTLRSPESRYLFAFNLVARSPNVKMVSRETPMFANQGRGAYDTTGVPKPPPQPKPR
ncbi:hypothetical protein LA080_008648 [Diaporthe eres]|nr:hypothetical protein LA080_008648 [Diaporthe eres]